MKIKGYILFLFHIKLLVTVDFDDIMQGGQMALGIYDNLKTITSKPIDIDSSLTEAEKDTRYLLLFTNFFNTYLVKKFLMKHSITSLKFYDLFFDQYKKIEEGLYIYLGKSRKDLENEWNKVSSKIDYILEKVDEVLFILRKKINKRNDYQKNIVLLNNFKNDILKLLLEYDQDQAELEGILKSLVALEAQVAGLADLLKGLFNNFSTQQDISDSEQYELFNIILGAQGILEYKNDLYQEKKKSLEKIVAKIITLNKDIALLIQKQNDLILGVNSVYKTSIDDTWSIERNKKGQFQNDINTINNMFDSYIQTGKKYEKPYTRGSKHKPIFN